MPNSTSGSISTKELNLLPQNSKGVAPFLNKIYTVGTGTFPAYLPYASKKYPFRVDGNISISGATGLFNQTTAGPYIDLTRDINLPGTLLDKKSPANYKSFRKQSKFIKVTVMPDVNTWPSNFNLFRTQAWFTYNYYNTFSYGHYYITAFNYITDIADTQVPTNVSVWNDPKFIFLSPESAAGGALDFIEPNQPGLSPANQKYLGCNNSTYEYGFTGYNLNIKMSGQTSPQNSGIYNVRYKGTIELF